MVTPTSTYEHPPIHIPSSAATLKGFRAWVASDAFPETARISYTDEKILIDMGPEGGMLHVPVGAVTWDGFRRWVLSDEFPQTGRISYLNEGIFIDMSPELETHNKLKTAIAVGLGCLIQDLELGTFYSDRMLLENSAAGVSTEPDAMFVSWEAFESNRVDRTPLRSGAEDCKGLEGAPDWVLEIVSPGSIQKDTQFLRTAYHQAGIPEYWLINALGNEIDFQILAHQPGGYEPTTPRDGYRLSSIFNRRFRLNRQRDRLGDWQYTLETKDS